MTLREVKADEVGEAFTIVSELRKHLSKDDFVKQVAEQRRNGYELFAAFDPEIVGVLGLRSVHTLARGWHFHIDDLVVGLSRRSGGTGRALLRFAEGEAKRRGMKGLFLDAVQEAIGFYEACGFTKHIVTLMRKPLAVS